MARYVGDTWIITTTVVDASNTPVDATSVSITILLPDGTTTAPAAMTHSATGIYTYSYPTTQAGMHSARFTATGAISPVGQLDFYVYPLLTGLVSLEEVRAHLRIAPASLPSYQTRLLSWIQASRVLIEDEVGSLTVTRYDEWYDGGSPTIMLLESPVVSVISVVETYGAGTARTLAQETPDGSSITGYGYSIDFDTGLLTRRVSGVASLFAGGRRSVHAIYTAGTAGVWRENFRLANLEQLRVWWLASQDNNNPQPLSGAAYDETAADLRMGGLSPRVMQMLGRRTRTEGIA